MSGRSQSAISGTCDLVFWASAVPHSQPFSATDENRPNCENGASPRYALSAFGQSLSQRRAFGSQKLVESETLRLRNACCGLVTTRSTMRRFETTDKPQRTIAETFKSPFACFCFTYSSVSRVPSANRQSDGSTGTRKGGLLEAPSESSDPIARPTLEPARGNFWLVGNRRRNHGSPVSCRYA